MISPLYSKVIFSLGIVLIIAAIGAIYITMIASQNNGTQSSNSSPSLSPSTTNSTQSPQGNSTNINNQSSFQSTFVSPKDNTIVIPQGAQSPNSGNYFEPLNAIVKPNSKITFKNEDSTVHTATANDGSFDTGNILPGSSKSVVIKGQGIISYHCTIHPFMKAKLSVISSQ
jgi:plastocyanin